jgi:WhiB family redox-sensing transcriptional regulator
MVTAGRFQLTTELAADWRNRAACAGYHHALFFPVGDADEMRVEQAREICMTCPVTEECLEYALETNQRAGIWGGSTEEERKSLRRKWLAARRRAS